MTQVFRASNSVRSRTVLGEELLVHQSSAEVHVLNATGTFLWQHIREGGASREALIEALAVEYEISTAQAGEDVDIFISELDEKGLIDA